MSLKQYYSILAIAAFIFDIDNRLLFVVLEKKLKDYKWISQNDNVYL
ncbi:MAG: hypothetical protein US11_C0001G0059 [Candidatus Roizmanbacteria bacterium GW2011_GWA2_36_23]|uniref:Uncharacterized protein n=1 Tax=Candidatus Roizmanbacteria bacterium GW2011_GWA2_36_23 TaxID=1618480 RepID=A0A0G0ELY9_9BACT|nr:MAG: hypothetical protein US11_C0001G0059 [Candidatus Roizmanbacteria bacterium GW2011_GWA2_36_23]